MVGEFVLIPPQVRVVSELECFHLSKGVHAGSLPLLAPPIVLPNRLDDLLSMLSDGLVYPVPVRGASTDCTGYESHDWQLWVTGSLSGRALRLSKCAHCEAVDVRDVSLDLNVGGSRLDRRPLNRLLGWYTGHSPKRRRVL